MKALIVDPYFDTLGGGERYVLSFARNLKEQGHEVEIAWDNKDVLSKAEDRFGLKFPFTVNSRAHQLFSSQSSLIKRFLFTRQYDLIFWVSDGSLPFLFSSKNLVHFQVPFKKVSGNFIINRLKMVFISKLVYNSDFTRHFIENSLPKKKGFTLYPPIDTSSFKPGKKENIILSVGRFDSPSHSKRQDILIKAFKQMQTKQKNDYRLVIAGGLKGDDKVIKDLKKQAGKSNIDFKVNVSFKELLKLFSSAKIFWHAAGYGVDEMEFPDKMEHFGMTTVEAMSAGLVPVVINKGGQKETVTPETGFLWDSIDQLVKQTLDLINFEKDRQTFSKKAQERSKLFSLKSFSIRLKENVL